MRRSLFLIPALLAALVAPLFSATPTVTVGQETDTAVTIADFAFGPSTVEIEVGTTVTWTNEDSAPHTATSTDGTFDSGQLGQGESYSYTFDQPGTYEYFCQFHPSMTATIVVTGEAPVEDDATPPAPTEVEATQAGASTIEFIGKVDFESPQFIWYGYLTRVEGLDSAALFTAEDPADWNESTARLTFYGTTTTTTRADIEGRLLTASSEGLLGFFNNVSGGATFDDPASFFAGDPVGEAIARFQSIISIDPSQQGIASGVADLDWRTIESFSLDGETYQLGQVDLRERLTFTGLSTLSETGESAGAFVLAGYGVTVGEPPAHVHTAPATPEAPITPVSDDDGVTVTLDELNDSGVSGSATLTEDNGETIVTLDLQGATGGHPAHIHEGTCDALNPNPIYPLLDVDADGASVTRVSESVDDLTAGEFAINVHDSATNIGLYIACGNIPQA